jgi:methylated-DNA-[protein]-cysteine S-methyltransferase
MNADIYKENALTILAKKQLMQYFDGEITTFNLPLAPLGTPFRQETWQALQKIPYGETRCYSEQAELMNNKKAVRAVGAANGANPISIIIPCHRVIGKDGSLTGYAGGLQRKAWLLNFEQTLIKK